jgi:3-phosphoshikimate 1-carboxyvinyltransferase
MSSKIVSPSVELKGTLQLPADKSISHRAVLFASLHEGKSVIKNFSDAADPHSTVLCMKKLGVPIKKNGDELTIFGVGRDGFRKPGAPLDCGNSGTTMRLLSGIVGGAGVPCVLEGDESLSRRTMKRIITPLRKMGINIHARDDDFSPLRFQGNHSIKPIQFRLPIASAQLKSCVLLAGLFGDRDTVVIETKTSRDHTERLLQLPVEKSGNQKMIRSSQNCPISEQSCTIPGDFSSAAFWLAAGSIHPQASIELRFTGINPTRTGALQILQKMGAKIDIKNKRKEKFEPAADIDVSSSCLKSIDVTPELVPNCIDEIPILLVAMLFADGTSSVCGAGELRHKETDRLKAMANVLETAGASFKELEDGFIIHGDPDFVPRHGTFNSEGDHRIAMAAAILASMAKDRSILAEAEATRISYPSFWDDFAFLTN